MKHLLIILSFLLLSSPVIGDSHKGETLYRWENPSGDGYIWKGFGDKETQPVYKGEVENGKPNGLGILISPYGWKYIGSWKDGKNNRKGTEILPGGEKFVGEFYKGKISNGTKYDKDGNIQFKIVNGKMIKQ